MSIQSLIVRLEHEVEFASTGANVGGFACSVSVFVLGLVF